jgi:hypothetical protein
VKKFLILVLMLMPTSVGAQVDRETRLIENVQKYYKLVGMDERASWLASERAAGRIVFGEFPANEADTHAFVNMRTGLMTINQDLLGDNTFRGLVDLGNALAHERVHQGQSYLGWAAATYQQDLGQGNPYERAGWAESLRVAREGALSLKARLSQAKSARERERVGQLLQHAVGSWQNLLTDWRAASREYGQFGPQEFSDSDGFPIDLEDMAGECQMLVGIALDATVTAKAMNRSYTGKYRGEFEGGASA